VTHILSMAHSLRIPIPPAPIVYLGVDAHDRDDYDVAGDFERTLAFLDSALGASDPTAVVLVHCAAGVSRSAIIVALYLAHSQYLPWDVAVRAVHACRPCVCPNMGFLRALQAWDVSRTAGQVSSSHVGPSASSSLSDPSPAAKSSP
jgi:protein-tyrosine phosphatase